MAEGKKEGKETLHPDEVSFVSSLRKLIGNAVTDNFTSYKKIFIRDRGVTIIHFCRKTIPHKELRIYHITREIYQR